MTVNKYENPFAVPCCLCDKRATWLHYNSWGIPLNTFCDEHKPGIEEVPC